MAVPITHTHLGGLPLSDWQGRLVYKERKGNNLQESGRLVKVKLVQVLTKGRCVVHPEGHGHTEDTRTRWLRPNWADNPDLKRPNQRPLQQPQESNMESTRHYIVDSEYQRVLTDKKNNLRQWSRDYASEAVVVYETHESANRGRKIMIGRRTPLVSQFDDPHQAIEIISEDQYQQLVAKWSLMPCQELPDVPERFKRSLKQTAQSTGKFVVVEEQWGRILCKRSDSSTLKTWLLHNDRDWKGKIATWRSDTAAQSMRTRLKSNDDLNSDGRLEIEQVRVIPLRDVDDWAKNMAFSKSGRAENELVVDLDNIDPDALEVYVLTIREIQEIKKQNVDLDESIRQFRRNVSANQEKIQSKKRELATMSRQSKKTSLAVA